MKLFANVRVAQVGALLYRRLAIGNAPEHPSARRLETRDTSGWKPALPGLRLRCGSLLVGLLWCVALVSVIVVGLLYSVRLDLLVAKNCGDQIQAHYLALAGIEKAKAVIYHDALQRKRASKNHSAGIYDSPQDFKDIAFGRGMFRVFHQGRRDEGGKLLYGIVDEEGRLNLNTASAEELQKLYGMTPEIGAAIMDWRDPDNNVTTGGAEADYYASLQPPYAPRNGPFQTVRELMMVRGVTADLFKDEDENQNGLLDPEEDDGDENFPPDNRDGVLDAGWSGLLTVNSSVANQNAAGQDRINIKTADEKALSAVPGISADLAKAIVAYRKQKQFENLADLLDVTASTGQNQPAQTSRTGAAQRNNAEQPQSQPAAQPSGPKLINEQLLIEIADDLTIDDQDAQGPININSAPAEVLACLPGITLELAQAIVSYRKSAGFFRNIAYLFNVDGMTRDIFKQIAPRITARSETFRILAEGKVTSTGARKRIEVIVHLKSTGFDTLGYREDL